MILVCVNNKGFENQLSLDKIYSVIEDNSETEYMISDETGNINYYPKDNFKRLNILY